MPNPAPNSGIRDNHRRGNVADFLRAKLKTDSRLSVVSAYFTIYAYEALKDRLDPKFRPEVSALAAKTVERDDKLMLTFGDQPAADKALKLCLDRGGRVVSFIPQRRSLEQVFLEEVKP